MTQSILTHLLAQHWADKPDKPTARGTLLRYSGAHNCARQMGYTALGYPQTNPMDLGDAWAPGVGTTLHEAAQEVIGSIYKTAKFEVMSQLGKYLSGATDALVDTQEIRETTGEDLGGTHVLWEFKSMGEWAFDQQVGYNRKSLKVFGGKGPKTSAITQAGINALGIEREDETAYTRIETLLMGSCCVTALSVNKAKGMNLEGFDRFGAEFRIPRDEWEPLALTELGRMELIGQTIESGLIPDRTAWDEGELYLNPRGKDWQCDYCAFRDLCVSQGEGEIKHG